MIKNLNRIFKTLVVIINLNGARRALRVLKHIGDVGACSAQGGFITILIPQDPALSWRVAAQLAAYLNCHTEYLGGVFGGPVVWTLCECSPPSADDLLYTDLGIALCPLDGPVAAFVLKPPPLPSTAAIKRHDSPSRLAQEADRSSFDYASDARAAKVRRTPGGPQDIPPLVTPAQLGGVLLTAGWSADPTVPGVWTSADNLIRVQLRPSRLTAGTDVTLYVNSRALTRRLDMPAGLCGPGLEAAAAGLLTHYGGGFPLAEASHISIEFLGAAFANLSRLHLPAEQAAALTEHLLRRSSPDRPLPEPLAWTPNDMLGRNGGIFLLSQAFWNPDSPQWLQLVSTSGPSPASPVTLADALDSLQGPRRIGYQFHPGHAEGWDKTELSACLAIAFHGLEQVVQRTHILLAIPATSAGFLGSPVFGPPPAPIPVAARTDPRMR